jgi:CRISPR-associated protein Csb1
LSPYWLERYEDTPELRLAAALASLIHGSSIGLLRQNLEPVEYSSSRWTWADQVGPAVVWGDVPLPLNVARILERGCVDARRLGATPLPRAGRCPVVLADIDLFLHGAVDEELIADLTRALCGITGVSRSIPWRSAGQPATLPRAYALLKLLVWPGEVRERVVPYEPALLPLLRAGRVSQACAIAARRLRASDLTPLADDYWVSPQVAQRFAAGLLFPITPGAFTQCMRLVLAELSDPTRLQKRGPTTVTLTTTATLAHVAQHDRILLEAALHPAQSTRFQPTGFPHLGAATFRSPDGQDMLLVESEQSMANRLEAVCWDEAAGDAAKPLCGMPYVAIYCGDTLVTTSLQEAHRLNSPYLMEADNRKLKAELIKRPEVKEVHPVDVARLARTAFYFDPNSVLRGGFLASPDVAGGRYCLSRLLSAFIEASDAAPVELDGVKFDRVDPTGEATKGFGHVPFHRTEFTAASINAYFSLDIDLLRAYRLGLGQGEPTARNQPATLTAPEEFLVILALWQIRRFLESGLRLRTACDLVMEGNLQVTRGDLAVPSTSELAGRLPELIEECRRMGVFANPAVTKLPYGATAGGRKRKSKEGTYATIDSTPGVHD